MNREIANKIYSRTWCHKVDTTKQANAAIAKAAEAGAYTICIESNSFDALVTIGASLKQAGFDVEPYNGSTDILEITWG